MTRLKIAIQVSLEIEAKMIVRYLLFLLP